MLIADEVIIRQSKTKPHTEHGSRGDQVCEKMTGEIWFHAYKRDGLLATIKVAAANKATRRQSNLSEILEAFSSSSSE
jgi:hypothetical protein